MPEPKLCLITGATMGLGYAMAREAVNRGLHVLALGRNQGALDDLADEVENFAGSMTLVPMDITDDNAIAYLAQSIYERWGKLNYWLHTAWFTAPMQPAPHLIAKDLDKAYQTNIRATARLIAVLDPILRQTRNAQAVFFDNSDLHEPNMSNVGLSKSAQMEIVKNWQIEARHIGPIVHIANPAPFFGQLRSTLYPGETRDKLSSPSNEAERILDFVLLA